MTDKQFYKILKKYTKYLDRDYNMVDIFLLPTHDLSVYTYDIIIHYVILNAETLDPLINSLHTILDTFELKEWMNYKTNIINGKVYKSAKNEYTLKLIVPREEVDKLDYNTIKTLCKIQGL